MDFGLGAYALGAAAGALSTLSPCVLPIVPVLLASAATAHRHAPLALAGGLALSYAVAGALLAWLGSSLGVDTEPFRIAGAGVLAILGAALLFASVQRRFASAASGIADAGNRLLAELHLDGIRGQFAVGLVLGLVWTPCVGPTLGAAIALASRGSNLPQVASMMAVFGIGAALPILALAYASRTGLTRARGTLLKAGKAGKTLLGVALLAVAVMVLLGVDKRVEAALVDLSPDWLTRLTTRF
jgi:cytochrome c biogenesis protein CcdA